MMTKLQIKLPVSTVSPEGWNDDNTEINRLLEVDADADASRGSFNALYSDSLGHFFLAAREKGMTEDIRDLPFKAFRQVDTLTALRWLVSVYQGFDAGCFDSWSGHPGELLEAVLELKQASLQAA